MSTPGNTLTTLEGYPEYTGGCSVHWEDIISTPTRTYYGGRDGCQVCSEGCSVHQRDTKSIPLTYYVE